MAGVARALLSVIALILFFPFQGQAKDVNWSKIASQKIVMFYPGVTSWEFLNGDDHRLGGREIKKGKKDCRHCHLSKEGELDLKTDEIAAGVIKMKRSHHPFEPEPLAGKKGVMTATVQAAYDNEFFYFRVEWDSKGSAWQKNSATPDRVSIQVNKEEPAFRKYGCFITCHNDLNTMPGSPSKKEVLAKGVYNGREDVRLYAFYARNSWDAVKGGAELDRKLREGGLIDLKSVEYDNGRASVRDGWVFDDRNWEDKEGEYSGAGSWANGRYAAVFRTKLKANDRHDISLSEGDVLSLGLAIHDDGAAKRKHYVSFPFSIGLGAGADIKAEKIDK